MATLVFQDLNALNNWAKARDLARNGADFSPALKKIAVAMRADALQNFQSSSDPDGRPWPPLAHPRSSSKGSDKPLMDRGILAGSVTGRGTNSFEEIEPHHLVMGSNLIYARLHQEGGVIRPKHARALTIPISKQAKRTPARDFPGLFRLPGKNILATSRAGKSKKQQGPFLDFHFVLVAQVRIPARPFLGFGSRLNKTILEILNDFVEKWESR